jgi:hypothetical protein
MQTWRIPLDGDDLTESPVISFHRTLSQVGEAGPVKLYRLIVEVQGQSAAVSKSVDGSDLKSCLVPVPIIVSATIIRLRSLRSPRHLSPPPGSMVRRKAHTTVAPTEGAVLQDSEVLV